MSERKICPIMSNDQAKVQCLATECQFFVEDADQCGFNEVVEYLDMMNTTLMMK